MKATYRGSTSRYQIDTKTIVIALTQLDPRGTTLAGIFEPNQ